MHNAEGVLVLSATDLVGHLECEHLTQLERLAALGALKRPKRDDPALDLLSNLGEEHEREHLNRYRTLGLKIAVIEQGEMTPQEIRRAERDTLQAMRDGADVIYQGTFFDGRWTGRADFLIKVAEPSALGAHSYEVVDAKLARHAKTRALHPLSRATRTKSTIAPSAAGARFATRSGGTTITYLLSPVFAVTRSAGWPQQPFPPQLHLQLVPVPWRESGNRRWIVFVFRQGSRCRPRGPEKGPMR